MSMRIAVSFVMKSPIGNHSFRYKVLLYIVPCAFDLLVSVHLSRECYFDLSGQLCVGTCFCFLHFVPQRLPVLILRWCMFRKQDLTHDNTALCGEVMNDSGFVVHQLLSGPICG